MTEFVVEIIILIVNNSKNNTENNTWEASYTVDDSDTHGTVTFTIEFTDQTFLYFRN